MRKINYTLKNYHTFEVIKALGIPSSKSRLRLIITKPEDQDDTFKIVLERK